jgi:hypothetical protein
MERPPRAPGEVFLPRWTAPLIAVPGVLLTAVTLAAFGLALRRARDDLVTAQTAAFCTLVIAHLGIGWAQRATLASSLHLAPHTNPLLVASLVAGMVLMVPLVATPLGQSLFHTCSLDSTLWPLVLGLAPLPLLGTEAVKAALRRTALQPSR